MMNKMMAKPQTSTPQNFTIISQETIKPSSPTPPHLKIHKLSLLDEFAPDMHTPMVFFYPNYKTGDTNILKQSLSKCLTQYYPFAGRLPTPPAPYINCNDEGVEFLEAFNYSPMDYFIHKNKQDKNLDQLFPYGLSSSGRGRASCPKLLEVQLNYFDGGGAAVAVSISHKLADAATYVNLLDHWATITRFGSPKNPHFISSTASKNINNMVPKFEVNDLQIKVKYATGIFVFSNSKLNELKKKVLAMGKVPANLTRVEVLTSLLFKHAVSAAKTKSGGSSEPSNLSVAMSLRKELVEKHPETAVGNFFTLVISKTGDSSEIRMNELIVDVRKGKMNMEGVRDEEEVVKKLLNTFSNLQGDVYYTSSVCGVQFYDLDFGWGKPVEVTVRMPDLEAKSIMLMDTPSRDGIKALVHLPEEEITILQNDKEFLSYIENHYRISRL